MTEQADMNRRQGLIALLAAGTSGLCARSARAQEAKHKLAIQVSSNDPAQLTLALNNAQNVLTYYAARNETVDLQIVTFGPGLHLLRQDSSPLKSRIATMSLEHLSLKFMACANTQQNMSKAEGKDVQLLSEAKVVPSGVITLMELQQKGYAYIRP